MWLWTLSCLLWSVWAVKGTVLSSPTGGVCLCVLEGSGNVTVGFVLLMGRGHLHWHSHGEFVSSFSLISYFPAAIAVKVFSHQLVLDQLLLWTCGAIQQFFWLSCRVQAVCWHVLGGRLKWVKLKSALQLPSDPRIRLGLGDYVMFVVMDVDATQWNQSWTLFGHRTKTQMACFSKKICSFF